MSEFTVASFLVACGYTVLSVTTCLGSSPVLAARAAEKAGWRLTCLPAAECEGGSDWWISGSLHRVRHAACARIGRCLPPSRPPRRRFFSSVRAVAAGGAVRGEAFSAWEPTSCSESPQRSPLHTLAQKRECGVCLTQCPPAGRRREPGIFTV
ncbi:hypothetical protein NDU88_008643 [Pleurodeles waltl]|uniref:Secreted protein n=1 Tax=Pleurodeles waltl TaxID=8319 RepID=A0AAV7N7S8_PLEWA|nr:hypothetical protein NDU88_008643 [Pleurodeles waltl]